MSVVSQKIEYGDFQTPTDLAHSVCSLLARRGVTPAAIVEPTCGIGALLLESAEMFPSASVLLGFDINPSYVAQTKLSVEAREFRCQVREADFFQTDWQDVLDSLPETILVLGNPPWVTNSILGIAGSANLPEKSNFQGHKGLDAVTGKSNFDISEWMLTHLFERLSGRNAVLAMLCKTTVARKVLQQSWSHGAEIARSEIHRIEANRHFGASVDACLLLCFLQPGKQSKECTIYEGLNDSCLEGTFGQHNGRLIANLETHKRLQYLTGESSYRWRSGVKHDCSKVMELRETQDGLVNGFGELIDIESDFLFPLAKSSDVAKGLCDPPARRMIVTQKSVGEDTKAIRTLAPKTWAYLESHASVFENRGSTIYRNRPRFSIFGIGGYTFSPWKLAISGFYKSLSFSIAKPCQGKPLVFDDTVYAIGCTSQAEAELLHTLLTSAEAQDFLSSQVFWDAKRPITAEILNSISLEQLAEKLGLSAPLAEYRNANPWIKKGQPSQQTLF